MTGSWLTVAEDLPTVGSRTRGGAWGSALPLHPACLAPVADFGYCTDNVPHFFYPVLDALNDGRVIRKAVALALRVLGVVFASGGLILVIEILKYSFRPDTTTETTLGGMLFSFILLAAFACVVEIHFYRARSIGEMGETAFTAIPVVSVLCRLAGEVYATLLVGVGIGGCAFLWLAKVSPLAFLSPMGGLLPASNLEASFLGGALLLIEMCLLALAVLAGFYAAAEGLLLAVDVAGNLRRLAAEPAAAPAGASEPAAVNRVAPREFCKVCGVGLVAGNAFCGNCGTRV